jgi:hypothetical protein
MKKLIILSILSMISLGGCVPIAVLGTAAGVGSVYLKYKDLHKEAKALDAAVKEVEADLDK